MKENINYSDISEHAAVKSHLPDEVIFFNPSNSKSVDALLSKYGPEGVFEIAEVLKKYAMEDVDAAMDYSLGYCNRN